MYKKPNSRIHFSSTLKSFATTLHFYSPKAYNYIRKNFFCSPHPVTLSKWYRVLENLSGINKGSLAAISKKLSSEQSDTPILYNLVLDGMKIKKSIELISDKEYGYIDIARTVIKIAFQRQKMY